MKSCSVKVVLLCFGFFGSLFFFFLWCLFVGGVPLNFVCFEILFFFLVVVLGFFVWLVF